jgi:hypothetical protein
MPPRSGRGGLLAVLLVAALAGGAPAGAEVRTARGTSERALPVARSDFPLGDGTTGRLEGHLRVLQSDAPEWNQARVFSVRFSDPTMLQNWTTRGQMMITLAGGDQAILDYEFTWKGGGTTTPFQLTGLFVHGTGRLTGIRGQWRERGVFTNTEFTTEWEVTYELK